MLRTVLGVVHGKIIELSEDLGVADGQAVEVHVSVVPIPTKWGEGILRSAGGWTDYPEMDEIMDEIHAARKMERRSQTDGE